MTKSSTILTAEKILELNDQYLALKQKRPDTVHLFRVGSDWVLLASDAQSTMRHLEIKPNLIDLGDVRGFKYLTFPHTELDKALPRLVRCGHRVAVCEHLEDPRLRVVKRGCDESPD